MEIELKVPAVGESITEVEIGEWKKAPGDAVQKDEPLVVLETEKATLEVPSPTAGVLTALLKERGATAAVGEVIAHIQENGAVPEAKPKATAAAVETQAAPLTETPPRVMPAAQRILAQHGVESESVPGTGPGHRVLKEDAMRAVQKPAASAAVSSPASAEPGAPPRANLGPAGVGQPSGAASSSLPRAEEVVPMTRLRRTVSERLVQAQQTAALLTTFNEVDMSAVMGLRKELGESFQARYGVKLGFMSFFVKAVVDALKQIPQVNAEIRGKDIVYHRYFDIGVAVGGGKGLVVPVLRNAERMSFAEIELAIAEFAKRARENRLSLEDLQGGTFTISNGGIYGSLLSTPIVNPPQSGVLGMHAIQERPVAREGQVVIRPMMYVALTYDHRLVDGREAVTFLRRVKEVIESPARMLVEV